MKRAIQPCTHPLRATVSVPGSKSLTNRALLCAALARGQSVLRNASDSDDTALMCNGLNQLGVLVRRLQDDLVVSGTGGRLFAPKFPIPVGNAGTTLRFLLTLASLAEGTTVFEGNARMAERPMHELLEALRVLGVRAETPIPGRYVVHGGSLAGGEVRLRATESSQFVSSVLLSAAYARADVTIELEAPPVSASYVDLTIDAMRQFGVAVERMAPTRLRVRAGQRYTAADVAIEPDASGATYFFAAAALCGGSVVVEGLRTSSPQPDVRFLDVLQRMGCRVEEDNSGARVLAPAELRGIECDMASMPDAVPTLAALAPFATTPTRIRNIAHLRHKESDRLTALATELAKLGALVESTEESLSIHPSLLRGGTVDTYNDHRLAMSFALIGLRVPGIEISNPECVRKSFPKFWAEFEKLYSS